MPNLRADKASSHAVSISLTFVPLADEEVQHICLVILGALVNVENTVTFIETAELSPQPSLRSRNVYSYSCYHNTFSGIL